MRFLKRPVTLPMWAIILVSVVFLGALGAATEPEEAEDVAATGTTITEEVATTTTVRPSTTTAAPTTTAPPSPEQQKAVMVAAFENVRPSLAEALESDLGPSTVSSVDRLEFDVAKNTIVLAVTSSFSTEEYVQDAMWEVTGAMLELWRGTELTYSPAFRLSLNRTTRVCPGDFMKVLADRRASRDDWSRTCR